MDLVYVERLLFPESETRQKAKKEKGKRRTEKGGILVRYAIAGKQSLNPSIHQSIKGRNKKSGNERVERARSLIKAKS